MKVVSQNGTGAAPAPATLDGASVVIMQEAPRPWTLRRKLGRGWRTYASKVDKRQIISARRDVFTVTDEGYRRFHRSGKAEGWALHTPTHGLVYMEGIWADGTLGFIAGFHVIPDWTDPGHEDRRKIIDDRCLPIIRDQLDMWHAEGRTGILAADTNAPPWPGNFLCMDQIKSGGMDRMWITTGGCLSLVGRPREGARVGAYAGWQHKAVICDVAFKRAT